MENFGKRLESLIKSNDLNNTKLGDKVGLSSAAIGKYIKGTSYPTAPYIEKMANVLNTSANYLITGEDIFQNIIEKELLTTFRLLSTDNQLKIVGETESLYKIEKLNMKLNKKKD